MHFFNLFHIQSCAKKLPATSTYFCAKRHHAVGQRGQVVMAAVMVFLTLSLVVVIGISAPISAQVKNTNLVLDSQKSVNGADLVNEDALYRLNTGHSLPATLVLGLNGGTTTAQVADVGGSKQIIALGETLFTERSMKSLFSQGAGTSINYGLQVGNGGLNMSGGPTIYGNVYSNGNIIASGGSTITGSASVASALSATPYIENSSGATTSPAYSVDVGKINNIQRIAQSFQVGANVSATAFSFYVKKSGVPANVTMKIYNNSGGSVGTTQIGSTGYLSSSLVGSQYDWVEVYPPTPITLSANTTYWLTMEWQGTDANYYTFAGNTNTYAGQTLKTRVKRNGNNWDNWLDASPNTADILFSLSLGTIGTITGVTINGSANAGVVNSSTVNGSLYCQTGSGNNKSCDTSQPLPASLPMPVSAANIQDWKDEASAGVVRSSSWTLGNNTSTSTQGAMRINGSLTVKDGAILTLNGPLYVTGLLKVEGGGQIKLSSNYGTSDEVIVANTVDLGGGGQIMGNGQAGNYVVLVADNTDTGSPATIKAEGGTGSVVLIAPYGTIEFSGGTSAKAAVANKMIMSGGTTLNYESGLADISFTSGPSGAWNVASWKEIAQ